MCLVNQDGTGFVEGLAADAEDLGTSWGWIDEGCVADDVAAFGLEVWADAQDGVDDGVLGPVEEVVVDVLSQLDWEVQEAL